MVVQKMRSDPENRGKMPSNVPKKNQKSEILQVGAEVSIQIRARIRIDNFKWDFESLKWKSESVVVICWVIFSVYELL